MPKQHWETNAPAYMVSVCSFAKISGPTMQKLYPGRGNSAVRSLFSPFKSPAYFAMCATFLWPLCRPPANTNADLNGCLKRLIWQRAPSSYQFRKYTPTDTLSSMVLDCHEQLEFEYGDDSVELFTSWQINGQCSKLNIALVPIHAKGPPLDTRPFPKLKFPGENFPFLSCSAYSTLNALDRRMFAPSKILTVSRGRMKHIDRPSPEQISCVGRVHWCVHGDFKLNSISR